MNNEIKSEQNNPYDISHINRWCAIHIHYTNVAQLSTLVALPVGLSMIPLIPSGNFMVWRDTKYVKQDFVFVTLA